MQLKFSNKHETKSDNRFCWCFDFFGILIIWGESVCEALASICPNVWNILEALDEGAGLDSLRQTLQMKSLFHPSDLQMPNWMAGLPRTSSSVAHGFLCSIIHSLLRCSACLCPCLTFGRRRVVSLRSVMSLLHACPGFAEDVECDNCSPVCVILVSVLPQLHVRNAKAFVHYFHQALGPY